MLYVVIFFLLREILIVPFPVPFPMLTCIYQNIGEIFFIFFLIKAKRDKSGWRGKVLNRLT